MKTIKNPISGDTIQLAERDFPERMVYSEAVIACKQLGKGWRLPSKYEWVIIQKEHDSNNENHFEKNFYWSSSFMLSPEKNAYAFDTRNGLCQFKQNDYEFNVRAVKALE